MLRTWFQGKYLDCQFLKNVYHATSKSTAGSKYYFEVSVYVSLTMLRHKSILMFSHVISGFIVFFGFSFFHMPVELFYVKMSQMKG
jgi:hypothetical protein